MKTPIFSILHATYGRPEKAIATMRLWEEAAARPEDAEYVFAVNSDDPARHQIFDAIDNNGMKFWARVSTEGPFAGSAPAWDMAARVSSGEILLQAQDDCLPPKNWDKLLTGAIVFSGLRDKWKKRPIFIGVSDGYRKDALCCTAILNRARMEQVGHFLFAGYRSVYSDDDVTIRALADAEDGKCTFINARQICFRHEHYLHNTAVPHDQTYARENSSEAYDIGAKLFAERNKDLIARGLRTWS